MELRSGFTAAWVGVFEESVFDLGYESAIFNECVVVEWLQAADSEFDERQRDPLVTFLDDPSLAENVLVQNNVMRVAVI
jgi:hypothetical protein